MRFLGKPYDIYCLRKSKNHLIIHNVRRCIAYKGLTSVLSRNLDYLSLGIVAPAPAQIGDRGGGGIYQPTQTLDGMALFSRCSLST